MASRKASAFSVYQQQKAEKDMDDIEAQQHSSESLVEPMEDCSRKRKRAFSVKKKKRRRLVEDSEEEVVETKKLKKAKFRAEQLKKLGKSTKSRIAASNQDTKKKTIISTRRETKIKKECTNESDQELEKDYYFKEEDIVADDEQVESDEISVHVPFYLQFKPDRFEDSRDVAQDLFRLVINPVPPEQFYKQIWEKKPLVVHRHQKEYNTGWFSTQELDSILRGNDLEFGTNIDLTTYEDGERQTHNPHGKAYASTVWEFFQAGCSVRLLNPATYSKSVWLLNSTLQEHFNSYVGANIYLTPADSQGFAPHYDDIEAFVLQLEGRKHWRVYAPKTTQEMLPLYSSENFSDQDDLGPLVVDTVLEPGDLLYFPRGFIHQANTLPDSHSMHITVSTYQKNTWGTVLEKLLPSALQIALCEDIDFRRGLPMEYAHYMGIVNSDKEDARRKEFFEKISELMVKLIDFAPVDTAADEIAADHIHSCLPPLLTKSESKNSIVGNGTKWSDSCLMDGITLTPDTNVRLIRFGSMRLVMEAGETYLYYTLQNSKVYREKEMIGMQIHEHDAPAMDYLINTYPEYLKIKQLPVEDGTNEDKVNLCQNLYSQGLLVINN